MPNQQYIAPTSYLPGKIISKIQQKPDRLYFTIQVNRCGNFFVQVFGKNRLLCEGLKQGDMITAITVPRSFRNNGGRKDQVYFELVGIFLDPRT